ncbi:hypothetical protein dsmv_2537 [Desulfococcus multivorans DSM 2059]|uniref:Uncharacterized protein n=1 Tax=Desulfococcus multivorans DSM 2059 TaxID=1121405 RepID=S7UZQ5_DESML|nr:hypothetical protein dsmv_2537 [Desulfococcus multivorans DSM 2059]
MVGVAQLVEHQVVALVAVGSSPITHPITATRDHCGTPVVVFLLAPVAQLDRASDFGSAGRGFESLRARSTNQGFGHIGLNPFLLSVTHVPPVIQNTDRIKWHQSQIEP